MHTKSISVNFFILVPMSLSLFFPHIALGQAADAPNASPYIQLSDGKPRDLNGESEKKKQSTAQLSIRELEKRGLELINRDRAAAGLGELPANAKLSALARAYAEKMKSEDFFAHVDKAGKGPQERAGEAGIKTGVYENLGWQSGEESDLDKLVAIEQSFMGEPVGQQNHRYIILKPEHTAVGVGIARKGDQIWLVHEYVDAEP